MLTLPFLHSWLYNIITATPSLQSTASQDGLFLILSDTETTTTTILQPFSRTTRVSQCQKITSGLYGAKGDC